MTHEERDIEALRRLQSGMTHMDYTDTVEGKHPFSEIATVASHMTMSTQQLQSFREIRNKIIEQKAYHAFNLQTPNLYADVATDASLHGQLMLLDQIITNVIVS